MISVAAGRSKQRVGMRLVALIFGLVWLGLWLAAVAHGPRGTDQYWYLADAATLAERGMATSNSVYPISVHDQPYTEPGAFVHNTLPPYLAGALATLFGAYGGWLVLNLLAVVLTTGFLFALAQRWVTPALAGLLVLGYLALPLVFWQATQLLVSTFIALLTIAFVWAWLRVDEDRRWWLVAWPILVALLCSQKNTLVIAALLPVFAVLQPILVAGAWREGLCAGVMTFIAAVLAIIVADALFGPANVDLSLGRALLINTGDSNVEQLYDLSLANRSDNNPVTLARFVEKITIGLQAHFWPKRHLLTIIGVALFNLLVALALITVWRCRQDRLSLRLGHVALGFGAVFVATMLLVQHQPRYILPTLAPLALVVMVLLASLPRLAAWLERYSTMLSVLIMIVGLLGASLMALKATADARIDRAAERVFTQQVLTQITEHDRIMTMGIIEPAYRTGWFLDPNPVLYLHEQTAIEDLQRLQANFNADWLLLPAGSMLEQTLGLDDQTPIAQAAPAPSPFTDHPLDRIASRLAAPDRLTLNLYRADESARLQPSS